MQRTTGAIHELPSLRDRTRVFADRTDAGNILADMLSGCYDRDALVLGIPAGGVPVAAQVARRLGLTLDVAVVSKITLPWNTEAGFGAVAFDGTVRLNQELVPRLGLKDEDIANRIDETAAKVRRRSRWLRGDRPLPDLANRPVILVDDGLASGFTMLVAIEALKKAVASRIIVAVPTAHARAIARTVEQVVSVYCPNIRGGWSFAVADAYKYWSDVDEVEVIKMLEDVRTCNVAMET